GWKAACLIVLLFFYFIIIPAYSDDNVMGILKKEFLKGYKLTQSGNSVDASRQFEKIRDLHAAMRDYILYYLGRTLHERGKCDEAKSVFKELEENYPNSRWALVADLQVKSEEPCPPLETPSIEEPPVDCESISDLKDQAECYFTSRQYRQ